MITQSQLDVAADGAAWKTATMKGYWKKVKLPEDDYGTGAFKLMIVEADATNVDTSSATHVYTFYFNLDMTKTAAQAVSDSTFTADKAFILHMLTASWQNGTATDYEAVRAGSGRW